MKLPRRNFLHLAAGAAALPVLSRVARAQAYPTRPVRIVAPTAPGGAPDILARLIGPWLSGRLGQQFIVENRPGGGTNIGTEAVVRAPADGYTLLLVATTNTINATLYDRLNFDFLHDIAPVAGIKSISSGQNSSRVHCLCQGEPGQDQFGIARYRKPRTCCWRAFQDDGRGRLGSCAVSWRRTRDDRPAGRTGAGSVRLHVSDDRADQGRQAASIGGDDGDALGDAA